MKDSVDSISEEHSYQKRSYKNYVSLFYPDIPFFDVAYKSLYDIIAEDESLTRTALGDFYFEKFIFELHSKIDFIEKQVENFIKARNLGEDERDYLLHFKPKFEKRINELIYEIQPKPHLEGTNVEKNYVWFKVGIMLAEGKLEQYLNANRREFKEGFSAAKIACDLGDKKIDKTLLAVIKRYDNNKNIFRYPEKLNTIIDYCRKNNIEIIPAFLKDASEVIHD